MNEVIIIGFGALLVWSFLIDDRPERYVSVKDMFKHKERGAK
jgi:hypothetical protein